MRPFEPLAFNHPLVVERKTCCRCGEVFRVGDVTTLVDPTPANAEEEQKARHRQAYLAKALPAHWRCR